jgi:ornithine cyclodeaminase
MVRHLDAATIEPVIDWAGVTRAITDGHRLPEAMLDDTVLRRRDDTLLVRSALIDGLGSLVKTATVFPGNDAIGRPTVNGSVALFSDDTGELDATLDFHLLTKWKTAGDSLLAATRLAGADVAEILIVGSGAVAASMIDAYRSVWPGAHITVWSRTASRAADLATRSGVSATDDLEPAVRAADIISTATMANDPILRGAWLRPGQHLDLIGGYRTDMREADDECIARSSVFVDSRHTSTDVGDIAGARSTGVLSDIVADFGDLAGGRFARTSDNEITVFKNAGGAHLDLMVARYFDVMVERDGGA